MPHTCTCSASTVARSTNPASPWWRCSWILYTRQNNVIHPSLESLSSFGTLKSSSNLDHFFFNIGPLVCSPFIYMCLTHRNRALSTSGHVTTWGHFEESAEGLELTWFCRSKRSSNFRESVSCENNKAPIFSVLKCLTTSFCGTDGCASM